MVTWLEKSRLSVNTRSHCYHVISPTKVIHMYNKTIRSKRVMSNLIVMHDVGNTYGSMRVYTQGGKFFWDIEDYDTPALDDLGNETLEGSEIPESLYKELLAHYYKDKPERDREEAMQEVLQAKRVKAQAEQWVVWAEEEKAAKELYRKNNPICDYATPALMLQGYYDGHVDRDAMLRTFDEASVCHVVCDVTGMITLGDNDE